MEIPPGVRSDYSFPVIMGMNENEPLSSRAPRMRTFMRLMRELDGGEMAARRQRRDTRAIWTRWIFTIRKSEGYGEGRFRADCVASGNENFLHRFMVFLSNVQKWEQERGKLESVDLRYGHEVILNPDMHAAPPQGCSGRGQARPRRS